MPSPLFVGTAGWTIPTRYAADFPLEGTHLQRYARRLGAMEINSSFYRPHRRDTFERWAASVPDAFRFAVKMPRAVTHECRLVGCAAAVARFADEVAGLGAKLAVVLVQLPPSLAHEATLAEDFFLDLHARLPSALAVEPRHPGWFTPEADARLAALRVSRVAADPSPVAGAERPGGWRGLAYYRLHGSPRIYYSDYDAAALARWQAAVTEQAARGATSWCIFDNTAAFAALGNALALLPVAVPA